MYFSKIIQFFINLLSKSKKEIVVKSELWKTHPSISCRDESLLTPKLQELLNKFRKELKKIGYEILVTETYRTEKRQDYLRKRNKSWVKVSKHQKGLAFDAYPIENGTILWNFPLAAWEIIGNLWLSLDSKTRWGGNWSVRDYGHFEITN